MAPSYPPGTFGDLVVALWYHITTNPQKLSLCPMCMSSYLQKPIRMHAFTCCKDMRHHKQPQRPRGWPGAFAFLKNFECIWTNLYTISPVAWASRPVLVGGAQCAYARAPVSIPATGAVPQRAPAQAEFYRLQSSTSPAICVIRTFLEFCVTRNFFHDDLCQQSGSLTERRQRRPRRQRTSIPQLNISTSANARA